MSAAAGLHFQALSARYRGQERLALESVTLDALPRRLTAVVGPNGSGKTTLVRALLRRVPLAAGSIRLGDVDLLTLDERAVARQVTVVPQREDLVFALPVREYVGLGRFPHQGPWRAASALDEEAVERALDVAGVRALAARSTLELSGGEWQRVRLARALAQGGNALVLDEPTTFLDLGHEMAMFELFAELARAGRVVLVVSHHLNLVARFADVIVLLDRGRVAAAGTPAAVMRAETLERVYGWPVVVTRDPAVGAPSLVPLRRAAQPSATNALTGEPPR